MPVVDACHRCRDRDGAAIGMGPRSGWGRDRDGVTIGMGLRSEWERCTDAMRLMERFDSAIRAGVLQLDTCGPPDRTSS